MNNEAETAAVELWQKLEDIACTTNLVQQGNPKEAFGSLETAKVETLERRDKKSDSAAVK